MPRPTSVQITRNDRKDGSVTFGLRVRAGGGDQRVRLGNSNEGWDEARAETSRRQLAAKIELGLWTPASARVAGAEYDNEPTFRELATDWLEDRSRNPAIRQATIDSNKWQLTRYLAPFFGELRPSQITSLKIRQYRQRIQIENDQIRKAAGAGHPLVDPRTGQRLRTLSNDSINKTLQTLAMVLDDAEEAGWIERNPARGRRTREPSERRRQRGVLDVDELLDVLEAADEHERQRHTPETIERGQQVRALRDEDHLKWHEIATRIGVAPTTAIYLYQSLTDNSQPHTGVRRAVIATLALAGPRVSELCALDTQDVDLARGRLHITDAKTEAGIRTIDIHPRLVDELSRYHVRSGPRPLNAPEFPTRTGGRRQKDNVRQNIIAPAIARANELRTGRGQNPIRAHVTPHTFRRTYITYMVAAGFDLPYIQAQVGHKDPTMTLSVYAQVMHRADRDRLRAEIRTLLGVPTAAEPADQGIDHDATIRSTAALRSVEKAGKGRAISR